MNCEICDVLNHPGEAELQRRILEGEYWVVTLRPDQEYLGTCFITVKRHVRSLPELSEQEENEFIALRNQLITAQERAFGAQVVNVSCLMNDAFQNGPNGTTHVHYHLKPRYAYPVELAGERFEDRQFGHYIKEKHPHLVSGDLAQAIISALQAEFH